MANNGPAASTHRSRLLEGMAQAVAAKGYAETTIADIVREAGVSRRTFYEHFSTKADCLVALYDATSRNVLKVLRAAIDPAHDWQAQVETALSAFLGCMAGNPVLLRTVYIEILGLGERGLQSRRALNDEITRFLLEVVNGAREADQPVVSRVTAVALVGGINELVLEYIEQDRASRLTELVGPASELVRAVTRRGA